MNEVLRQEQKYLLTLPESARLRAKLEAVMRPDAHNGALGYSIRSLYFDTPDEQDFYEKLDGLELRRKLRLRVYDPAADFAMLELKQKEGAMQRKRSLRMSRADAMRLIGGDLAVLQAYQEPFAAECYGLMETRCYRPKTIVEYQRKAFVVHANNTRLTFDSAIVATESNFGLFEQHLALYPVLDPFHVVMELKYNGFLFSYIKELTEEADRTALSVSKYCLARSVGLHYSF